MSTFRFRLAGGSAFLFAGFTVLLDAIGVGIVFPIMPELLSVIGGIDTAGAAVWGGVLIAVNAFMMFLFSPLIGNLSDAYGRRPVLLLALAAMALDYLILGLAHGLAVLIIGRAIAGAAGATYVTVTAYLADVSESKDRSKNFGLVGAIYGLGFIIGPALGGTLAEIDVRVPLLVAAALSAGNALFGYFVLPESLRPEKRRRFELARANPFRTVMRVSSLSDLRLPISLLFVFETAAFVYPAVWAYFCTEAFGWSTGMIGVNLASYGACLMLVQGVGIRFLVDRFGEGKTLILGLAMAVLASALVPFAPTTLSLFMLLPLMALSDLVPPVLTGIMANRISDDEQGELQGVLASLGAVQSVIGPLVMTGTFQLFAVAGSAHYFPGAPFLLCAALTGALLPGALRLLRQSSG